MAKKTKKRPHRMLIVDVPMEPQVKTEVNPDDPKQLVIKCPACGRDTNPSTRMATEDGRVVHLGCSKAKGQPNVKPVLSGLPKHRGVKVPVKPEVAPGQFGDIAVMCDYQGRTCIQVKRDINTVTFIPMDVSGFHLAYAPVAQFDGRYKPLEKYPIIKACEHYRDYAVEYGATDDVLRHLGKVVTITEEQAMAAKKKLEGKVTKVNADGTTTVSKKKGGGASKPGSGARIRELIMQGKDTESIIATIHKEFPGSKAGPSDVSWNRGKLRKEGKNPPELKTEKKAPAKKGKEKKAPAKKK